MASEISMPSTLREVSQGRQGLRSRRGKKFRQQEIPLDKKQLEGTWCYISGASRGIGAFIAQTMAKFGVNLVLQGRTIDGLRALREKF